MRLRMALGVLLPVVLWAAPPQDAEPERRLEQAIHREMVVGDLPGAIEQYRAILARTGQSRAVAARALFQMAQCL